MYPSISPLVSPNFCEKGSMETPYHRKCRIEVDFPTHSPTHHNPLTQKRKIKVWRGEGVDQSSVKGQVSMCTTHTHTHTHTRHYFFYSRLEGMYIKRCTCDTDLFVKFFLVQCGEGPLGTENSPKVAILRRGGGRLHLNTALLCFALLNVFFLNPTDYVENGGKRMMEEDGMVQLYKYMQTSTGCIGTWNGVIADEIYTYLRLCLPMSGQGQGQTLNRSYLLGTK